MVNFPPEHCPYCGTELEAADPPTVYRCESCDDWVFHNAVLGGGVVVVDGEELLLIEDFREAGSWKVPEGRPEIPESPREGVARELEEEAGLTVDAADLVYLYDDAKEVVEGMHMMGVYYAVHRSETTGTVEAGSDATDARFWTPEEFAASDQELRDMPNPDESRSWDIGLARLRDLAAAALERETTYAALFAPHLDR
ncbi:NUDIX hydrolase [Halobacteriales archaeon QH_6_68_27]|nr:MAG: NUDIX hydrolase [Halobacteriales archaeon QH_1_68_42]PSP71697.1 MAG: NUDIX hydrolase [Halobacteriales archaeon QH_6_68_27]